MHAIKQLPTTPINIIIRHGELFSEARKAVVKIKTNIAFITNIIAFAVFAEHFNNVNGGIS